MCKKLAALVLMAACLTAAVGAAGEREPETASLYDKGLEVIQVLSEMAGSEEYIDAFTGDSDIKSILQQGTGGDYAAPKAVYALSVADGEMEDLAALIGLELDDVSDEMMAFLMQRMLDTLPNRANSLDGAETLAAANVCVYQKTFVDEAVEDDVIYLYTYEDTAPVAVTFTTGEDHTVTASGVFLLCDGFTSGSAEEIADFFDYITVDVTEVLPEG